MLDRCQTRAGDRLHDLAGRFVAVLRLVDGDHAVGVDDDARLTIGRVHLILFEGLLRGVARHTAAGPVVDAIATRMGLIRRPEDEARVPVASRDENRVSGLRVVVAGWKRARCALAVHVDPTELRMMLALDKVVADFVHKRKWFSKELLERPP